MKTWQLWPDGPEYGGDAVQTDALALCDFVKLPRRGKAADLGCGSGIMMLLLALRSEGLCFDGAELRAAACREAEANFRRSGLAERCRVTEADVRALPFEKNSYELVVCNPPYFDPARGAVSPDSDRAAMRHAAAALTDFCTAAGSLLKSGGSFYAVYRADGLGELFAALCDAGLTPRRLRCVQHDALHAPSLILCEAKKGGGKQLRWEAPLLLRQSDGSESADSLRITHWKKEGTL